MDNFLQWAVAAGLGAILLEVVRSLLQRKKMGADAARTNTETAISLLEPLRSEITRLQGEVESTRQELISTRRELTLAKAELTETRREVRHLRDRVRETEKGMD